MSDDFQDDDQTTEGGKLRKQFEAELKKNKDLQAQIDELTKQVRASSVKDLFSELKANPKGVKFYNGEPTKEALAEWLKGDGDIFAKAPEQKAEGDQSQDDSQVEPDQLSSVNQATLEAARAAARMQPTPATPQGLDDLADKVGRSSMKGEDDLKDLEKLWEGIRNQAAAAYQQRGY